MPKTKKNLNDKMKVYKKLYGDIFYINSKEELICRLCTVKVNSSRKSLIDQHLKTSFHKSNIGNSTSQTLISFDKEDVKCAIFDGFVGANIPIHKIRHESIMKMFNTLGISIPSVETIRRRLNTEFEIHFEKLKINFQNKYTYLMCDETQFLDRRFVHIVMGDIENPESNYLVDCIEIYMPTNSKIMLNLIDDVIREYDISKNNFLLLVSDAAPYMMKMGKDLKHIYQNMNHITCFMHKLHNCAVKIKNNYHLTNNLISAGKELVKKNYARQRLFTCIGGLPKPVITRWGTWLHAAIFYAKNLSYIKTIAASLDDDGIIVHNMKDAIHREGIEDELIAISSNYSSLLDVINDHLTENTTIKDVLNIIQKFKFEEDRLNLEEYVKSGMDKTDIFTIKDGDSNRISMFLRSKMLNCPGTTTLIERSFSLLQKVVTKERHFKDVNIKKYMMLYFNANKI